MSFLGSSKSSSSSTSTDNAALDTHQIVQTGDALQQGVDNKGSNQRLTSGSGISLSGDKSRLEIHNDLSAGVAHDSVQGIADVARFSLDAAASQSADIAALAQSQQQSLLSAVTQKAVGPDASRFLTPVIIGAVVIAALFLMARK